MDCEPRHPASLAPISSHNPALLGLLRGRVTAEMLAYVVEQAASVVPCRAPADTAVPTPPATPTKPTASAASQVETAPAFISLDKFIAGVVRHSHVQAPTLLCSLVFLDRLRARLPAVAKGAHARGRRRLTRSGQSDTLHRIFLATLIVTAKALNGASTGLRSC